MAPRKATPIGHTDTRKALLLAAREEFAHKGFEGARVDEIANKAGVNKALINYHFGNKANLFTAIIEDHTQELTTRLENALRHKETPLQKLRAFIACVASMMEDYPSFPAIMLQEVLRGGKRLMENGPPQFIRIFAKLKDILAEGANQGVFRPVHPGFFHIHLISSFIFLQVTDPIRRRVMNEVPKMPLGLDLKIFTQELEQQILSGLLLDHKQKGEDAP